MQNIIPEKLRKAFESLNVQCAILEVKLKKATLPDRIKKYRYDLSITVSSLRSVMKKIERAVDGGQYGYRAD